MERNKERAFGVQGARFEVVVLVKQVDHNAFCTASLIGYISFLNQRFIIISLLTYLLAGSFSSLFQHVNVKLADSDHEIIIIIIIIIIIN